MLFPNYPWSSLSFFDFLGCSLIAAVFFWFSLFFLDCHWFLMLNRAAGVCGSTVRRSWLMPNLPKICDLNWFSTFFCWFLMIFQRLTVILLRFMVIYGDIWWVMPIYGDLCWFCRDVWWFMVIYGDLCGFLVFCFVIYSYFMMILWWCMVIYADSPVIYDDLWWF